MIQFVEAIRKYKTNDCFMKEANTQMSHQTEGTGVRLLTFPDKTYNFKKLKKRVWKFNLISASITDSCLETNFYFYLLFACYEKRC
jgi:hypothetical protein